MLKLSFSGRRCFFFATRVSTYHEQTFPCERPHRLISGVLVRAPPVGVAQTDPLAPELCSSQPWLGLKRLWSRNTAAAAKSRTNPEHVGGNQTDGGPARWL